MRHALIICPWLLSIGSVSAQRFISPEGLMCAEGNGAVRSTVLHSDSVCTSFFLCIDQGVRPHLHRTHTEHVFVVDGLAEMMLGDSTRTISSNTTLNDSIRSTRISQFRAGRR